MSAPRKVVEVTPIQGSAHSVRVVLDCGHVWRRLARIAPVEVGREWECQKCPDAKPAEPKKRRAG